MTSEHLTYSKYLYESKQICIHVFFFVKNLQFFICVIYIARVYIYIEFPRYLSLRVNVYFVYRCMYLFIAVLTKYPRPLYSSFLKIKLLPFSFSLFKTTLSPTHYSIGPHVALCLPPLSLCLFLFLSLSLSLTLSFSLSLSLALPLSLSFSLSLLLSLCLCLFLFLSISPFFSLYLSLYLSLSLSFMLEKYSELMQRPSYCFTSMHSLGVNLFDVPKIGQQ